MQDVLNMHHDCCSFCGSMSLPASLATLNEGVAMVARSWSDLSAEADTAIDDRIAVTGPHM